MKLAWGVGAAFLLAVDMSHSASSAQVSPAAPTAVLKLPPVTVDATSSTTYNVTEATPGTKTETPIMDTPRSVTVIPQQVSED